jgi:hypothetical protein
MAEPIPAARGRGWREMMDPRMNTFVRCKIEQIVAQVPNSHPLGYSYGTQVKQTDGYLQNNPCPSYTVSAFANSNWLAEIVHCLPMRLCCGALEPRPVVECASLYLDLPARAVIPSGNTRSRSSALSHRCGFSLISKFLPL